MRKKETIIILSLMRFDGLQSTNFTIAKYLARDNDVYYIEHPYSITDYIRLDKKSGEYKYRKEGFRFFSTGLLEKKIDGVNVLISRFVLPINFLNPGKIYNSLLHLNEALVATRIKSLISQKKISDYIFINAYNFFFPTLGKKLSAKLNIYYCVDPIPKYHRKHGIVNENKLIKTSDLIICTSKALFNEKKKLNSNCYFVPNGADLVETIKQHDIKPHPTLHNIMRPVIGYIGAIERRIDYNLIQKIVQSNKDKSFVFVGPVYKENLPDWFFKLENIHIVPPISYDEVADMIYAFDVCMIPFKKDEISDCIFPLKLFEYLGIGKPVVLTNFNEDLKSFTENLVEFAATAEEFSNAVETCLRANDQYLMCARIQLAQKNTWQNRADMINDIISKNLSES